jgi:hypothetical protein
MMRLKNIPRRRGLIRGILGSFLSLLLAMAGQAQMVRTCLAAEDVKLEQVARTEEKPSGDSGAVASPSKAVPELRGEANLQALIKAEARRENIAPEIVDAVMAVESSYNPGVIGTSGEIGLMQVMPSTARLLGFAGSLSDLAVPATNIHYGTTYLARAWRLAGGDLCTTVMKYRAGHGETRFSDRSVSYCLAVRAHLQARGYPVTGTLPIATFGEPSVGLGRSPGVRPCRKGCLMASGAHLPDLAPLNKKLSELVWQTKIFTPHGL